MAERRHEFNSMKSIQRRLSVGLISVLIIIGLLLVQTSSWLFEAGLRRYFENHLHLESENLLAALVRGPQGIELDQSRISSAYKRPFSGYYFRIEMNDETWRSRSSWDHLLPLSPLAGLQQDLAEGPQAQRLLLYRADYRRFGQTITLVVAQDYTPMLRGIRHVQWIGLALGLVSLISILLLQRIIVARALRPLEQVRQQIAQLQQGQRAELDTQVPEELEPLVDQINHLLLHTEDTLKRSRNALGNLGHALKTPLAVLFSICARSERQSHTELRESLRTQLDNIQQRLSRELGRARLAGEALPGAHFTCAEELPALFSTLALIHNRDLQLNWQAPPDLRLPWDREDILELLGNLLDNACKWAGSQVQLEIAVIATGFEITVDDDGPGIDTGKREEVLSRGTRLDEQTRGHGLGLGIVRDIVDHFAGDLLLKDSPLGGLQVAIRLPNPTLKG